MNFNSLTYDVGFIQVKKNDHGEDWNFYFVEVEINNIG